MCGNHTRTQSTFKKFIWSRVCGGVFWCDLWLYTPIFFCESRGCIESRASPWHHDNCHDSQRAAQQSAVRSVQWAALGPRRAQPKKQRCAGRTWVAHNHASVDNAPGWHTIMFPSTIGPRRAQPTKQRCAGRTWVAHHHVSVDNGNRVHLLALVVDAHARARHRSLVRRGRGIERRRVVKCALQRQTELPMLPLAAHVHHALPPLPRHLPDAVNWKLRTGAVCFGTL